MYNIANIDMKAEVIVIPVSEVDRATEFYRRLGWRLDVTPPGITQFTPHGSACSIQFGPNLTSAVPGSAKAFLVVTDIVAACDALSDAGIAVGAISHFGTNGVAPGPDPERRSYRSRAPFNDPDGNIWLLQEVTSRLPGRVEATSTSFTTSDALAAAMRRAEEAHGEHERRTGEPDPDWADWYARYLTAEQNGSELPD